MHGSVQASKQSRGGGQLGRRVRAACCYALMGLAVPACIEPVSVARQKAVENWSRLRSQVVSQSAEEAYQSGAFDSARRKLVQIIEDDPGHEPARLLLAHVYIESEAPDKAARVLLCFRDRDDAPPEAYYLLGAIEELSGRYAAAAHSYRLAAERRPDHLVYVMATVEALLSEGEVADVREFLLSIDRPDGLTAGWHCLLAEVARAEGDNERAAELYEKALDIETTSGAGGATWVARELAGVYQLLNRHAEAAVILERLVAEPGAQDRGTLLEELASCRLRLGQIEQATRALERIEAPDANTLALWLVAGRHDLECGRWDRASAAVHRVLDSDPNHADALMLSASLAARTGDTAAAGAALGRWHGAHPSDPMIEPMRRFAGVWGFDQR